MRILMRGLTVLMLWQAASLAEGAEWLRLRVAVHVDSSVSHTTRTTRVAGVTVRVEPGARPPAVADIAAMAREQGLDAMVMADFARADIAYGLTPFSRLFKLTVSQGSIATYGARRYLEALRAAEAQSGVIIIPGVESMPYYRWTGGRFTGQPLRLKHAYEHLVLCGFETPEQFERIPNTAGGYGRRVTWAVGLNAVFAALWVLGFAMWRKPGVRLEHGRVRTLRGRCLLGALLMVVAVLALVDGAPFLERRVSPYAPPARRPAELFTDYAREQKLFAYWAHPDVTPGSQPHRAARGTPMHVEIKPYPEAVSDTPNLDGFAMFNAGVQPGLPGGHWDRALRAYCRGESDRPVWVLSECDFDADSPADGLADAQTVVWASERSAGAILDALRHGRAYATKEATHRRLEVRDYTLADDRILARSGATLTHRGGPLHLNLVAASPSREVLRRVEARVIVDGDVVGTLTFEPAPDPADGPAPAWGEGRGSLTLPAPAQAATYVRVLIFDGAEPVAAMNPIFIRRAAEDAQ